MPLKQDNNTSIICTSIYSLLKRESQRKKNHAVDYSLIYFPKNFTIDFMSLALKELNPPLPCARPNNFMAKDILFDDDDDDPCLLKKLSNISSLLAEEDSRLFSSFAAKFNSWNSLSSLLLLPLDGDDEDDDDDDKIDFNKDNLLNESDCVPLFESPDSNPLRNLLKL